MGRSPGSLDELQQMAEDLISLPKAAELLQKRTSEIETALNGPGILHAHGD